jgi:hypothetical protein
MPFKLTPNLQKKLQSLETVKLHTTRETYFLF